MRSMTTSSALASVEMSSRSIGDECADQRIIDLVDNFVGALLDLVHLGDGVLDLGGVEVTHDIVQLLCRLAGELCRLCEAVVIECVVLFCHDGSFCTA